ncbi:sigma-70 family RNA polymerase sigma factor [Streptomyces boncukensis]|uniref:Sigma-70 family RNA polymerase sigma factor n=1 Tax=Streptomyces boncukensis TaxID=2711219 RepID=A0A6G4X2T5_9ACTN|nr:sigma-70 family RNA polymerase sigma factor [Streptomyces boncukensis]NGO71856.1 sigma-70 family RNA polymerase sigma factor [Streptomyces boncukensis]
MTQEEPSLRQSGHPPAPERPPLDFSAFHQMHRPKYIRWAERVLGCRAYAEDAVDEAFERLLRRWDEVLKKENPAAYAWATMKNCVCSHARSRRRRADLTEGAAFDTIAVREAGDSIGELEQTMSVFAAISELPERQRDVIALRYCFDFSTAETAQELGITEAGVRSHERHAKKSLRGKFEVQSRKEGQEQR